MGIFKKPFTKFLLVLLAGISGPRIYEQQAETVRAETTTDVYLKISANWLTDNPKFAVWAWISPDVGGTWFDMSLAANESEIYVVSVPNTYDSILFARLNPSEITSWDYFWNKTSDLTLNLTSTNMYVINEGMWGGDNTGNNDGQEIGYWSSYSPIVIPPSSSEDPNTSIDDSTEPPVPASIYTLHYWRNDGKQREWDLWLWTDGMSGTNYPFTGEDDYGRYMQKSSLDFTNDRYLYIIIRPGSWSSQTPDIKIDVTEYPLVDGRRHFYLVDMETTVYKTAAEAKGEKILTSGFTGTNTVSVTTYKQPQSYTIYKDDSPIASANASATYVASLYRYEFSANVGETFNLTASYYIKVTFTTEVVKQKTITFEGVYDTAFFINTYTYSGNDLGVTYSSTSSTFKLWAPTSSEVLLRLYDNGTPLSVSKTLGSDEYTEYSLTRGDYGVWSKTINGDLHGVYYTFVVTNTNGTNEVNDPYAKASGVNGIRGMVVDFNKTDPTGWNNVTFSSKKATEIIPYELHVRDLTMDDTWNGNESKRGKFLGLIEKGTMYQEGGQAVTTGFDHIKELGVNAVQILPFYDQENDETHMEFNWGYNPKNYNVLEGGYSSNPYNGLVRINEFKQVVQAYANEDIRIIMDVVYNHVASISQHSFSKVVPNYYFRYSGSSPSNASGVGNDTASERIMFQNYMVDSSYFLATEYKLGGFRFDLMGLHTVDAMNAVANKLATYRDDMIVYGEPWDMDGTVMNPRKDLAKTANLYKTPNVGGFNDQIRDAIKGSPSGDDAGWVQLTSSSINSDRLNKIKDGMMGKITNGPNNPSQTINYVSVHDNYAIYDKIYRAGSLFRSDPKRLKDQAVQAEALSLLSQGVSFIHAGSEIMRSKPLGNGYFDHNSYKSSDAINSIKWDEKYVNLNYHNYYRQMIALKRYAPAFNYATRSQVDSNSTLESSANNLFRLTYKNGDDNYTIYHFGVGTNYTASDLSGQEIVVDTSGANPAGTLISGNLRITTNMTLVTRNVRDRGSNDLTKPVIIGYVDFIPFIPENPPTSEETSQNSENSETYSSVPNSTSVSEGSGSYISMPETTSLPEGISGEPTSEEETPKSNTPVIIASVAGGSSLLAGIFVVIKILRKKP